MQREFSQLNGKIDARLETRLQGFKDDFKAEIGSELHGLFEKYFGSPIVSNNVVTQDREERVMGSRPPPHGFPPKGPMKVPQPSDIMSLLNPQNQDKVVRWGCPHFDGTGFRAWWSKLEQYFEVEGIPDSDKVRTMMLNLEGKALDWHYFYAQKHEGLQMLEWPEYAISLREWFDSSMFAKPMSKLVTLKQQGSVEQYHDEFILFCCLKIRSSRKNHIIFRACSIVFTSFGYMTCTRMMLSFEMFDFGLLDSLLNHS